MARLARWAGYLPGDMVRVVPKSELDFCRMAKPRTAKIMTDLLTPELAELLGQHGIIVGIRYGEHVRYTLDIAPNIEIDERLIRMYQPKEKS